MPSAPEKGAILTFDHSGAPSDDAGRVGQKAAFRKHCGRLIATIWPRRSERDNPRLLDRRWRFSMRFQTSARHTHANVKGAAKGIGTDDAFEAFIRRRSACRLESATHLYLPVPVSSTITSLLNALKVFGTG